MVIYDIATNDIIKKVHINPNQKTRPYMFVDD